MLYCLFFKWPSRIISLFQMSLSVFRSFLFKCLRQMQNLLLVSLPFYRQTTTIKPLIFFYVLLFYLFSRFPNHTFVKMTLNTCFLSLPSFIHPANYQVFMLKYRYHNFLGKRIETEHILHRYIHSNISLRDSINRASRIPRIIINATSVFVFSNNKFSNIQKCRLFSYLKFSTKPYSWMLFLCDKNANLIGEFAEYFSPVCVWRITSCFRLTVFIVQTQR